jgi:hypothetical protein
MLACQNHPQTETRVSEDEDFRQVEDGGYSNPYEYQLNATIFYQLASNKTTKLDATYIFQGMLLNLRIYA